jgi:hypothetical protein
MCSGLVMAREKEEFSWAGHEDKFIDTIPVIGKSCPSLLYGIGDFPE